MCSVSRVDAQSSTFNAGHPCGPDVSSCIVTPVGGSRLRQDDDLALEVSCAAGVECCSGLRQRKGTPDGHRQCPFLEKGDDLPQRWTTLVASAADKDLDSGVGGIERHEGQHPAGATRELDRKWDLTSARCVEDGVDSLRRNSSDALAESLAIADRF